MIGKITATLTGAPELLASVGTTIHLVAKIVGSRDLEEHSGAIARDVRCSAEQVRDSSRYGPCSAYARLQVFFRQ